jgi:hypothetical protein
MDLTSDRNVIKSVLGFNLNVTVTYQNDEGEEVPICNGCRSVPYLGNEKANVGTSVAYGNFFTNFNQALLSKIKDYQSKNY